MNRRRFLRNAVGSAALPWVINTPLHAQESAEWPAKPLRLIVPGSPGGGSDIMARVFVEPLSKALGQPVIVENRPGANGLIGNDFVAKAKPDGYTMLLSTASAVSVNAALRSNVPYDTLTDLAPVMQISAGGVLLVTAPSIPARNYREFVDYVRANPDIAYGSFGVGSTGHLAMEAIAHAENLKMRHVAYKAAMQIVNDLQNGVLSLAFVDARSPLPFVQAGKLTPIAVTGTRRVPALPDVMTLTEQGFKFDLDGWYGFFLPGKTPPGLVERVNQVLIDIVNDAPMQQHFKAMEVVWVGNNSPTQFAQVIRDDIRVWSEVVKTTGVQVD